MQTDPLLSIPENFISQVLKKMALKTYSNSAFNSLHQKLS